MANTVDNTPQQRFVSEASLRFLNMNRTRPFLSAVKDEHGEQHMLLLGDEKTVLIELHDNPEVDVDYDGLAEKIQDFQDILCNNFNVVSSHNHVLVVQLPKTISDELFEVITKKVSYQIPTIFVPATMKSTAKLQGNLIVLPEVAIAPDLTTPQVMNWDTMKRLVQYLDKFKKWDQLPKNAPIGRVSVHPTDALIKIDTE